MASVALVCLILAFTPVAVTATEEHTMFAANPIRKVVTMLQAMQAKISAEGEREEKLYEQFQCYCRNGGGELGDSIASAEARVPAVSSDIEQAETQQAQLKLGLKQHQVDRDDAKNAVALAGGLRQKEATAFAVEKNEAEANIAAVKSAVAALEKGLAGSFVQTAAAQVLQRLVLSKQGVLDGDRQEVLAFLSNTQDINLPQSGEIVGILKGMAENMETGLAAAADTEKAAAKTHDELMAAKKKELASLASSIESKTQRIGELAVSVVQMKNELSDVQEALGEDKKYLADLDKTCAAKSSEWEQRKRTRSEELVALADVIKLLSDDDALELFKQTLPSASSSFVQVREGAASMKQRALSTVMELRRRHGSPQLDFIVLALRGKTAGFEKVIVMIDAMVNTLKGEQQDDNHKKEYCAAQFDHTAESKKELDRAASDAEVAIADTEGDLASTKEAIAALGDGIEALDKAVAGATEQRKAEHAEFSQLMSSDAAAKELLGLAKNRLHKYYNKALYKAPPKRELSEEDRIAVNMGGTAPPTAPPGGIAGTGITALMQVHAHSQLSKNAPAPPPETFGAYAKKSGESTGIVAMIDLLIKDLEKEMDEARTQETDAQADYETLLKDSAAKRAGDAKALTEKGATKAELEADLGRYGEAKASASKELAATAEYVASLHAECDFLLQYFTVRMDSRNAEIDSLTNAKAVLSGADFGL